MGKVNFKRGTSQQYASKVPDNDTIYFLTDTNEICLGDEVYSSMYDIKVINNKMTVGTTVKTDRFHDCTRILNPLYLGNATLVWGCPSPNIANRIVLFTVFSLVEGYGARHDGYILWDRDSENDPYELTLDNAPHASKLSSASNYQVYLDKNGITNITSCVDVRCVQVVYDENDKVIDYIYSTQYRYFPDNGKWTRTLFQTALTSDDHLIDVGLYPTWNTSAHCFNFVSAWNYETRSLILPLVSASVDGFDYVIDDSLFENHENGLSIVATDGQGICYIGPVVYKDTGDYDGTIYEIYDGSIEVTT